eukprot:scaffold4395_cov123-Isochrysis_galbana.AAC.6
MYSLCLRRGTSREARRRGCAAGTALPCSLAGEGDSIPQHKSKLHTSRAHGDEARKAQGGGKRNLHLVFRGRWISTRGPSHTPFGGVRQLASTYRQCGANRAPPDKLYSHSMVIVGCFDLHIARHIPPSAVKLPLCHCGRLVGLSPLSTTHASRL